MYGRGKTDGGGFDNIQPDHELPVAAAPGSKEDEKMPLFLIKLWNIVEDPSYQQIIRWDESGYSFHIIDPYSFCRNVLPHYFKHNNLNSLIRQLNMYGFRKMTPLDRGGLTRSESDQDHLEFSHPYFVREHPELLVQIKRKASSARTANSDSGDKMQSSLNVVMDEIRSLREKQKNMDVRMERLVKENEALYEQISHQRAQHHKQQQVVNKLVQFLVALVQPTGNKNNRLGKRSLLAIDEPPLKRARGSGSQSNLGAPGGNHLADILDRLQRELLEGGISARFPNPISPNNGGPIIADVTDELAQVTSPFRPRSHGGSPRGVGGQMGPSSGANQMATMSSAPLAVPRGPNFLSPRKAQNQVYGTTPQNYAPNRSGTFAGTYPDGQTYLMASPNQSRGAGGFYRGEPSASSPNYSQAQNTVRDPNMSSPVLRDPTLTSSAYNNANSAVQLSPSIDRQLSTELQEYLNGVDMGIGNCREMIGGHWDVDFDPTIWDTLDNTIIDQKPFFVQGTGEGEASWQQRPSQQLALEDGVVGGSPQDQIGQGSNDPLASPASVIDVFTTPQTPDLLTPTQSPAPHL